MEIFMLAILLGLIPGAIAKNKGHSFIIWWIFGALIFIVALPVSLIMKPDKDSLEKKQLSEGMKKCPYCAEMIKNEASVCRYCNKNLMAV